MEHIALIGWWLSQADFFLGGGGAVNNRETKVFLACSLNYYNFLKTPSVLSWVVFRVKILLELMLPLERVKISVFQW